MRFAVIKSVFQTNMLLSETCFFLKAVKFIWKKKWGSNILHIGKSNLSFKLLFINVRWYLLETRYLGVKLLRAKFICLFLLLLLLLLLFAFISFWYYSLLFFTTNIFIGNKAKGRISKRVFQENRARQIFGKTKGMSKECSFFRKFDVVCLHFFLMFFMIF